VATRSTQPSGLEGQSLLHPNIKIMNKIALLLHRNVRPRNRYTC
jgi:hypothetical protein